MSSCKRHKKQLTKKLSSFSNMLVHGKRVKIFYFSNTFKSINWGSQATSAGMRHPAATNYPAADFETIDFATLPLRWFPYLKVIPNL